MGIDVSATGVVTFNGAHEQRVVTDVTRPVPTQQLDQLLVASVLRRRKAARGTNDGNPLIYALKGKNGHTIPRKDFIEIYRRSWIILPNALGVLPDFDVVVPLPSSSNVARILAKRAVRLRPGARLIDCLEKATVGHALANSLVPGDLPERVRQPYKSTLNAWRGLSPNSRVEMKLINQRVRPYINPVIAGATAGQCRSLRVLLVDDLLGSGASLTGAHLALSAHGPALVCGLTFLSRLSRS